LACCTPIMPLTFMSVGSEFQLGKHVSPIVTSCAMKFFVGPSLQCHFHDASTCPLNSLCLTYAIGCRLPLLQGC